MRPNKLSVTHLNKFFSTQLIFYSESKQAFVQPVEKFFFDIFKEGQINVSLKFCLDDFLKINFGKSGVS